MRVLTSPSGQEEAVTLRRSESADAAGIEALMGPPALAVFGRVNVLHLLEKANLAVTVASEEDEIVAHASFFDHPLGGLVDQTQWEPFVQKHFGTDKCTTLNTLFLHLFVAQPEFASASVKEILRAVFNSVVELEFIFLLGPHVGDPEPALKEAFKPLQRRTDPEPHFISFMCRRGPFCPALHVRSARVEDHDDIMRLFEQQTSLQQHSQLAERPFFLAELVEAQDEENQTAVCENDGVIVGFLNATSDIDLELLQDFDLSEFEGLFGQNENDENDESASQSTQREEEQPAAQPESREEEEETNQTSESQQQEETELAEVEPPVEKPNAFCIQLFVIDKNHEMRSADFMPYVFKVFPELDYCIITVPTVSSELPLLQSFVRAPRRTASQLPCELYICARSSLSSVEVRPAVPADRRAVSRLVTELGVDETLLQDLKVYCEAGVELDGRRLQAYMVRLNREVVGVLILRDEEDIEYVRSRYNIENFIYFSHHGAEEHALIRHFVLQRSVQHFSRHVLKDVLRLSRRSCLYLRVYPRDSSPENSCIHHLDAVLNSAVPVRPRRQIVYPLEKLGANAPSRRVTQDQAPFTLSLVSRKLTMEPKVVINARIVVVGASDTGLSFLEVLCFCPHLRFNNLTLVSTHGFPGDSSSEDAAFLSTSHFSSSRDFAQRPLHYCITVVIGKMVAINRKSKYISLSCGGRVSYDDLILCTGLQYQVPSPSDADLSPPVSNSLGQQTAPPQPGCPAPSNLHTLNDPHDCSAARHWLCANFVELEDNAVVYGNSLDVFTTVETLLGLGISGRRIHLVLTPPEPGVSCFGDPAVEAAVFTALAEAEVRVYRGRLLTQMNDGNEELDWLKWVSFSGDGEPLRLECGVFINLSNRGVDYDAFKSINDAFLVFDSRLVVDTTFRTNDEAIFGAGPLTKFSCSYHADQWSHANFSSREVGQELAAMLLPMFDPTLEPPEEPSAETERLVPLYKQAKIRGGKLPGGFNYLHVTKPSAADPRAPAGQQDGDIVTGRAETGNYFRLHLDRYERVETITCLCRQPLPVSNYLSLFGKHQRLLGQLSTRHHQGLIDDLYSFFTQSWCLAVCHDRFSDFEQELQEIAAAKVEAARQQQMDSESDDVTQDESPDAELIAAVRSGTVKYLNYNRNLLPMFAYPGQV